LHANAARPQPWMATGDQWNEFIRLLTPDEQPAFMADVWNGDVPPEDALCEFGCEKTQCH
jgi:hypothetical protein